MTSTSGSQANAARAVACGGLLGVLVLNVIYSGGVTEADKFVLAGLHRMPRPELASMMARAASVPGEPWAALLTAPTLAGLGAALFPHSSRPAGISARAVRAVAVLAVGASTRRLLCDLIARPRPPRRYWMATPHGHSFPSKHTTLAALALGAGTAAYPRAARRAATALCLATGLSRVYLGVHWPSDVASGWLLAAAWLSVADLPGCSMRPGSAVRTG